MSFGRCPVCSEPKEKKWHLVCPYCWVKVPAADQEQLYELYQKARGTLRHVIKCRTIVRDLLEAKRATEQPSGEARVS